MAWGAAGGAVAGTISGAVSSLRSNTNPSTGYEKGNHNVYEGVDPVTGQTKYIGRTNNPLRRFLEHGRSKTPNAGLKYQTLHEGVSLRQARILEQNLINKFGLENLNNKIHSIGPNKWSQFGIVK